LNNTVLTLYFPVQISEGLKEFSFFNINYVSKNKVGEINLFSIEFDSPLFQQLFNQDLFIDDKHT